MSVPQSWDPHFLPWTSRADLLASTPNTIDTTAPNSASNRPPSPKPHAPQQARPPTLENAPMGTRKSIALFIAAAVAEIGGAWLIWQGVREHRGWIWSSLAASRYSTGSGTTSRSSA